MKKVLLIFGAGGSLGSGALKGLTKKNFDEFYLFDSKDIKTESDKINFVQTSDLNNENNIITAFRKINYEENSQYFLFSTIGGYAGGEEVMNSELDSWQRMLDINVTISFLLGKHFLSFAKSTAGGSICFTSAMTSLNAEFGKAAYGASKNALNYLVKTLALEGKKYDISVNAIAPSVLDTPENREWIEDKSLLISPKDIGELVFSLFEQSRIVSGNIIELPATLNS